MIVIISKESYLHEMFEFPKLMYTKTFVCWVY